MIVAVANTKGGVGKTTLATQLALAERLTGRNVLLVDADAQGSAQNAATMRAEAGREPALACVQITEGKVLRGQLGPLASRYDVVLIDVGGRDGSALRVAMLKADTLVMPIVPRAIDVWAVGQMADLIDQAQAAREEEGRAPMRVIAALNLADPAESNPDTVETIAALGEQQQFNVCPAIVRRRKAVANAMAHGLAVSELQPRDAKACEEIEQLIDHVFGVMEVANGNHSAIKAR